ncbi:hypothetical protein [Legionella jordanis]|uniref:Uncharacterized protein n=1 Tax=Legionella jordanis TaxID=456 RepID=A0A0W0VBW0_9GAMM|nr:hypothetical protein [Legionella jordanis]KTD17576.1 hypothetical protein Ljor_1882 [Legionella jordanis]RMX05089.1 hypothetical protein EAW55_00015 [Legionella jordanis]RMX17344.1 hypothetical protein EAS68_10645 [Legionella jordanis]VEH13545.1 Uncharacterised protein [Legionella jordanis]HAT8714461.1 hypothetical protein [Legionella jordanis]
MLISQIHEFISALLNIERQLGVVDKEILASFQKKYPLPSTITPEHDGLNSTCSRALNEDELNWLQECFAFRWRAIADTPQDYTFDPQGQNVLWINLAKALALSLKKHYLELLIPPLAKNKSEPDGFSRLDEEIDPRDIYLSNDGSWRRIKSLYEKFQQPSAIFQTYDQKKINPRALTLKEMFRIRAKRGEELIKQIEDETYANFWDYLIRRIAPTWQKKGKCPDHILPSLLELIEIYFNVINQESNKPEFNKKLAALISELETCSVEDINHFYGIEIYGDQRNYYLVDILLDCLAGTEDLEEKLANIARWLCRYDPTLVSKCKNLTRVYENQRVGKYFDAGHLRELILKLDQTTELVKPGIQQILRLLEHEKQITAEVILKIKAVYELRWRQIIDTPSDYLRKQAENNRGWIRLAQYLAGAGYIEENYYQLLIPTIKFHIDPVTKEKITNYPLSHFILSEDGEELIYIPNCIANHQANGTFYCFTASRPRMLTAKELERLKYVEHQFYAYYLQVLADEKIDLPVSRRTIMAVRDLVNATLNPKALRLGYSISESQEKAALLAYGKFSEFLSQLPSDEYARLYAHSVIWRHEKMTVGELLEEVQSPYEQLSEALAMQPKLAAETAITPNKIKKPIKERECAALVAQKLAKLVMDYDPDVEFNLTIRSESISALAEMRLCSAKRVFRDWDHIDDKEATRRVSIIMVSLMTHSFSYLWFTGVQLEIAGYSNTTTETGKELFKTVELALELGDFSKIRFIYTYLIRKIVQRAMNQTDFKTICTRYEDTLKWLQSIEEETMFKPENCTCFEPKQIFVTLVPFLNQVRTRSILDNFLQKLIHCLSQPQNEYIKWIQVNIEFNRLLNKAAFSFKQREEVLSQLRQGPQVSEKDFLQQLSVYLVHKLSIINLQMGHKSQGLFGVDPGQYNQQIKEVKKSLQEHLPTSESIATQGEKNTLNEIFKGLKQSMQHTKSGASHAVIDYLDTLENWILAKDESCDVAVQPVVS